MNTALRWQRTRVGDYVQNFDYAAFVDGVQVARVRHSPQHSIKGLWQVFIDDGAPVLECTTRIKAMKVAENLVGKIHRLGHRGYSEFPNRET
jgi:hypothetical protein